MRKPRIGLIGQGNLKRLMQKGLNVADMVRPLAKMEGKRTSTNNIYQRSEKVLEKKLVSADEVREWKTENGRKDAEQIIDFYELR